MRILHVITMLEIGGAQYNTIFSAEDAVRRGHESWVVASHGPLAGEATHRLGPRFIPLRWLCREPCPFYDPAAYFSLRRIMRRLRPDVVHTHSSKAGILGRWAASAERIPLIVHTAHGWGFHDRQNALVRKIYVALERAAARKTHRLIGVSAATVKKGLEAGVGRRDQYSVIRSGIELDAAKHLARRPVMRNKLRIPADAFVVASIGNFKAQKDPITAARVIDDFLRSRPSTHYISAGDGVLRDDAMRLISEEVRDRVHYLGWRDDPIDVLAVADVMLHTAIFEGLPRVVLEAMALGIPVVSTDVDGIPEAVRDGETGFLFPVRSPEQMTEALRRLHDDPALRKRFAEAAQAAFSAEFTLPRMFDQLEDLYRREWAATDRAMRA